MRTNCDSIRPLLAANAESAFLNGLASSFAGISDLQRQHTTRPVTGDCSSSTHLSSRPPCCVGRHCATCLARPRELYGARLYLNSGNSPLQAPPFAQRSICQRHKCLLRRRDVPALEAGPEVGPRLLGRLLLRHGQRSSKPGGIPTAPCVRACWWCTDLRRWAWCKAR